MLDQLRRNSRSAIIYLLFGIIIIVFIFTFNTSGPGGGCSGGDDPVAATVDDVDINMSDLRVAMQLSIPPGYDLNRLRQQPEILGFLAQTHLFRLNQGTEYLVFSAPESLEDGVLERKVISDLTETILVSNKAREMGFRISNAELSEFIQNWSNQQSGTETFDMEAYSRLVQYGFQTSKQDFEELVKRELLRHKMIQYVSAHVVVDDALVDAFTEKLGNKTSVSAITINEEAIVDSIVLSDETVKAYVDNPENGTKLQEAYTARKAEFVKPERTTLHGLFKEAKSPARIEAQSDSAKKAQWKTERDKARTDTEALLAQLKDLPAPPLDNVSLSDRLAALSEQSDHGPSKSKGALLGTLGQEALSSGYNFGPALGEAAFALNPNTLSDIVEVNNGFWIVVVDEKLAAEEQKLAEVQEELARTILRNEGAAAQTAEVAKALLENLKTQTDKSPQEIAEAWNKAHSGAAIRAMPTPIDVTQLESGPAWSTATAVVSKPRIPAGCIPGLPAATSQLSESNPVPAEPLPVKSGFECDEDTNSFLVVRFEGHSAIEGDELETKRDELRSSLQTEGKLAAYQAWYRELAAKSEITFSDEFQTQLAISAQGPSEQPQQ